MGESWTGHPFAARKASMRPTTPQQRGTSLKAATQTTTPELFWPEIPSSCWGKLLLDYNMAPSSDPACPGQNGAMEFQSPVSSSLICIRVASKSPYGGFSDQGFPVGFFLVSSNTKRTSTIFRSSHIISTLGMVAKTLLFADPQ